MTTHTMSDEADRAAFEAWRKAHRFVPKYALPKPKEIDEYASTAYLAGIRQGEEKESRHSATDLIERVAYVLWRQGTEYNNGWDRWITEGTGNKDFYRYKAQQYMSEVPSLAQGDVPK